MQQREERDINQALAKSNDRHAMMQAALTGLVDVMQESPVASIRINVLERVAEVEFRHVETFKV